MSSEASKSSTCIPLYGFTPVRRRDSTVNTRQFHGEQEKEWTAARCHRLLRALTSRVAILRKDITRLAEARRNATQSSSTQSKSGKVPRSAWDQDEGEWGRPKKKVRRTYSSRTGKNATGSEVPKTPRMSGNSKARKSLGRGEIMVPTPILARARGDNYIDEHPSIIANAEMPEAETGRVRRSKKQCITNDGEPCFQLSGSLREMRQKINASRFTIYEGIYNGLEAILRSTMDEVPEKKRRKGARSLFSTALKAVPDYISVEEAYIERTASKSAINTRDISREIYDELEAFGSSGQGWKQLRIIVRSHGIQVLRDAIAEGLLDADFCGVLITLCIHSFATEEAAILLESLLSSRVSPPKTLYDNAPQPFSMLWKFVEYTGRYPFQYRQLGISVTKGILPLSWLATKEFRPVWTAIMQRLSPESMDLDALTFLESTLPLLSGSGQSGCFDAISVETVKHTLASLLTTLVSIVVLSLGIMDPYLPQAAAESTSYEHLANLLRSCVAQYRLSQMSNSQGALLHLANMIVRGQLDAQADTERFLAELLREDNDEDLDSMPPSYNELVAFICSIARCCGRGASSKGFEYLEYLHLVLEKVSIDSTLVDVFQGLIVDSAFAFAQQLPEQAHIEYASLVDTKFSARNVKRIMGSISEAENETRPGFRWEEGIGEWVMATPGNDSKQSSFADYASTEGADINSPLSAPQSGPQNYAPQKARLAQEQVSRSSNIFVDPEEDSDTFEDSDPIMISQDSEMEAAESDDELQTSLCIRDPSQSDVSISEAEASSDEMSEYSDGSPIGNDLEDVRHPISRAPRLGRRPLQATRNWQVFDDSFTSTTSASSRSSRTSLGGRQFINRAPRLGRKALVSSQAWKIFDESDDELSFCSVSSRENSILRDITTSPNTTKGRSTRNCKTMIATKQKECRLVSNISDSEDELGI